MSGDQPTSAQAEERRRRREREIVFGKAQGFQAHHEQTEAFWRGVDAATKLEAIVELVRDSWYLSGRDGPAPRLDRSAHGVCKLGG